MKAIKNKVQLIGHLGADPDAEKYLLKGSEIAVEGRLLTKAYTDKNAIKRVSTDIIVSDILILSKKNAVAKELV